MALASASASAGGLTLISSDLVAVDLSSDGRMNIHAGVFMSVLILLKFLVDCYSFCDNLISLVRRVANCLWPPPEPEVGEEEVDTSMRYMYAGRRSTLPIQCIMIGPNAAMRTSSV